MVVNIEIKNQPHEPGFDPTDRAAGEVVALVEAMGRTGSVVVSSFWSGALAAVRSAGSAVPTGLLVVSSFDPLASIAAAADLGCAAVHLPVGLVDAADRGHGPRRRPGGGRLDGGRPRPPWPPCWRPGWTRSSPTTWPWPAGPSTGADRRAVGPARDAVHRVPPDLGRGPDWSKGSVFVNNARS